MTLIRPRARIAWRNLAKRSLGRTCLGIEFQSFVDAMNEGGVLNKYLLGICPGLLSLILCVPAGAASLQKAIMYNQHGLKDKAKSEFIDLIFSKSSRSDKAEAYYFLGAIAFDERKISVALDSWKTLVAKFPKSKQAKLVKGKISELAEIVGESAEKTIKNAVARSYLRHGHFWSKKKSRVFNIDGSWISNVEAANKWYGKVIAEFPNTPAAELAYENQLRTLLGWKERGRYGSSGGIKENFLRYMPRLLETFAAFERDFPESGSLQAFRYQIAQAYWNNKDWKNTRKWLNKIIGVAGNRDSFYKDLAKRRLQKVEY